MLFWSIYLSAQKFSAQKFFHNRICIHARLRWYWPSNQYSVVATFYVYIYCKTSMLYLLLSLFSNIYQKRETLNKNGGLSVSNLLIRKMLIYFGSSRVYSITSQHPEAIASHQKQAFPHLFSSPVRLKYSGPER